MITIKRSLTAALAAALALLAIVMLPATGATKSNPALRSYHGKVTRISPENNAFRLKLNRGSKRFRVNAATEFQGIGGFAGLVLGSISRHVAERATCPVLVVHAPRGAHA